MYNRYIPQSDGSYRKNQVPDQQQPQTQRQHRPQQKSAPPKQGTGSPSPCPPPAHMQVPEHRQPQRNPEGITSFFKQLLPKNLDTADLLIIILLLLMAGDCEEERNNALLTLALYFLL